MKLETILFRLLFSLLFSLIVGIEREKNQSNAGIKTHSLVGVSSTLVALLQYELMIASENSSSLSVDSSRIIAQVVSGIGFLGAGTIIVTKNNVSGLTTAASIWSVSMMGISIGMGYYLISICAFLLIIAVLFLFKNYTFTAIPKKLLIKYEDKYFIKDEIDYIFKSHKISYQILRHELEIIEGKRVCKTTIKMDVSKEYEYDLIMKTLSKSENIIELISSFNTWLF